MPPKLSRQNHAHPRAIAARIIRDVHFGQHSLSRLLEAQKNPSLLAHPQRALIKQICFGSVRWYIQLDALLKTLLHKPIHKKNNMIHYVLISALYQLSFMRTPDYAVVNESLRALTELRLSWAKDLVNAVLRQYLRKYSPETKTWLEHSSLAVQYAHPQWLVHKLQADWGDRITKTLLAENNREPPLWLRVNTEKITPADYHEVLRQNHLQFTLASDISQAVCLRDGLAVEAIPGFTQGLVSVQDGAAQFAAPLLELKENLLILDACAAPGGKSAHILESCQPKKLLALDISPPRLQMIAHTLKRLELDNKPVCCKTADISLVPDKWWDGQCFDRILLDAPCSATGVIRRHPDIKLLRKKNDIHNLIQTQQQILHTLWPLLKPDGILLYATCSILRDENDRQLRHFLQHTDNAVEVPIHLPAGKKMPCGWQILPGEHGLDGFYYAKIKKQGK